MPKENTYEHIQNRIAALREKYPSLKDKSDAYIFSALFVEYFFCKNADHQYSEQFINNCIMDGKNDGGIDILLRDPNSEEAEDLIVGQGKYKKNSISKDEIYEAIVKMYRAIKDLEDSKYKGFNPKVKSRFVNLYEDNMSDESKIIFYFYTSAKPKKGTNSDTIIEKLKQDIFDCDKYDVRIYFSEDIWNEIGEVESKNSSIGEGIIYIDKENNFLAYNNAIIVNASALSFKKLWAHHGNHLLAKNLRYYIASGTVDDKIKETIRKDPDTFWYKNNGITIVCEDFEINDAEVKLKNFSIVNGGQTTFILGQSNSICKQRDVFLPCKIIKDNKKNEDFIYQIAIATNTQKPIKLSDQKANAPEQLLFKQELLNQGVYYQTKRGEDIPTKYKMPDYLNTKLGEVGMLYLAAIFQKPGTSRSNPLSALRRPENYYNKIFNFAEGNNNPEDLAKLFKELVYINYYYKNKFIDKYQEELKDNDSPLEDAKLAFARNARTLCIAFAMFVSRYRNKNITSSDLKQLFASVKQNKIDAVYDIFQKNINMIKGVFPKEFIDKEAYEDLLYNLFKCIIRYGVKRYEDAQEQDETLNATNYLKKDRSYYGILSRYWDELEENIKKIFSKTGNKDT